MFPTRDDGLGFVRVSGLVGDGLVGDGLVGVDCCVHLLDCVHAVVSLSGLDWLAVMHAIAGLDRGDVVVAVVDSSSDYLVEIPYPSIHLLHMQHEASHDSPSLAGPLTFARARRECSCFFRSKVYLHD